MENMVDDNLGIGLALGSLLSIPMAIGTVWFLERSYNEGLKGSQLVSRGIIFGRTSSGALVSVSKFDQGRQIRLRLQNLEWKVYQLEQAYSELKAGYTVTQSRIEKIESELVELWNVASKIPELRKKLEALHTKILVTKEENTPSTT